MKKLLPSLLLCLLCTLTTTLVLTAQDTPQEQLWLAIDKDNTTRILHALSNGASLELPDEETGEVPLVYFVTHGNPAVIEALFEAHPSPFMSFRDPLFSIDLRIWSFLALFPQEINLLLSRLLIDKDSLSITYVEHEPPAVVLERFHAYFKLWLQAHPLKERDQELLKVFKETHEFFMRYNIKINDEEIAAAYHQEIPQQDFISFQQIFTQQELVIVNEAQALLWAGLNSNSPQVIKKALENGAVLTKPTPEGEIPLVYLATHSALTVLKVLTNNLKANKLNLNYKDPEGVTLVEWAMRALFYQATNFKLCTQNRPAIRYISHTNTALVRFDFILKSTAGQFGAEELAELFARLFKEAVVYYNQPYSIRDKRRAQSVIKILVDQGFKLPASAQEILCTAIPLVRETATPACVFSTSRKTKNPLLDPLLKAIAEKDMMTIYGIVRTAPELLVAYHETWAESPLKELLDLEDAYLTDQAISGLQENKKEFAHKITTYWQELLKSFSANRTVIIWYLQFFSKLIDDISPAFTICQTAYTHIVEDWLLSPNLRPRKRLYFEACPKIAQRWVHIFKLLLIARLRTQQTKTEPITVLQLLIEANKLENGYLKMLLQHSLPSDPELEQQFITTSSLVYTPIENTTPSTTPLEHALTTRSAKLVELLLRHGAEPFTKFKEIKSLITSIPDPAQSTLLKKEFTDRIARYLQALRGQALRDKISSCFLYLPNELLVHVSSFITGWEITQPGKPG